MTYKRAEYLQLTAAESIKSAYGEIEWSDLNGSWRGNVNVAADGFGAKDLRLQMKISRGRPSEPTVILLVRGTHMKRVDVNGEHRGRRETHVQWSIMPGAEPQYASGPDWFYPLALGDNVPEGAYRRVFGDAAKVLGIDIQAAIWIDPPEMR